MYTASLYTDTGSYWVYALIKRLYCYLGTLARHTCYATDGNKTIINLRHFGLEESLQEDGSCTAEDNLWIVVLVVHSQDDGTHGLTFTIYVGRNLL